MNIVILHNDSSIASSVINYTRLQQICTGVGTLEIALEGGYEPEVSTWDVIKIYEEGNLVGTYNINNVSYDVPAYLINIEAQDDSKKLQDYFIPDTYEVNTITNNQYWIEKFLDEATVSYQFQDGLSPALIQENTTMGKMSAYEQITQLLQMSGWYMYFDNTNVCIIGKVDADLSSPVGTFTEEDIVSISTSRSDSSLRNRAVVWGSANPLTGEWVFADVHRPTRWDAGNDSKAVVLSSSSIDNTASATSLANKMLDEWAKLNHTKEIRLTGARNISLGDVVRIESKIYDGLGVVTSVGAEVSSTGFLTTITLDESCPRLFGMVSMKSPVYVGTWGDGVKRKALDGYSWSDYSSGLTNLNITDLAIKDGILSCVAEDGSAFISKETWGNWREVSLPSGKKARATTIDKDTNNVRFLVDTWSGVTFLNEWENDVVPSGCDTYVLDYSPNLELKFTYPIMISGTTLHFDLGDGNTADVPISSGYTVSGVIGYDVDNDGFNDYISIGVVASGFIGYESVTGETPYYTLRGEVFGDALEDEGASWDLAITIESLGETGFYVFNGPPLIDEAYTSDPEILLTDSTVFRTSYTAENAGVMYTESGLFHGGRVMINFLPETTGSGITYRVTFLGSAELAHPDNGDFELQSLIHPDPVGWVTKLTAYNTNSINKNYTIDTEADLGGDPSESVTLSGVAISGVMVVNTTLRREGEYFTIMDPGVYPQRVDNSGAFPMLVAEKALNWFDIVDNTKTASGGVDFLGTVYTQSGLTMSGIITDMRYTNLIGESASQSSLVIAVSGCVYTADISDITVPLLPESLTKIFETALVSGELMPISGLTTVETSNYISEGQYIFTATDGANPKFYQQSSLFAQDMSENLGEFPVTIIRLDDRV